MDQKITVTFSHSCDNCGSVVTDRDQIFCASCLAKFRAAKRANVPCHTPGCLGGDNHSSRCTDG